MPNLKILFDAEHEAEWFRSLHPSLATVPEAPISGTHPPAILDVLRYDRPDIILLDGEEPILVVEETVEVPTGHNVGQRYARIAAAAESSVPFLYFFPYVAKKHGGKTAGRRYVNVRLFHSLDVMVALTNSAVTSINWPVDDNYEVRRDPDKDAHVREYMDAFLACYSMSGPNRISSALLVSPNYKRMVLERDAFVRKSIKKLDQYNNPPPSVEIMSRKSFESRFPNVCGMPRSLNEVVLYKVGMSEMRSDPFTGAAFLYHYLYVAQFPGRALVLWFPKIDFSAWERAARSGKRKDVRLFRHTADAILFADAFKLRGEC